MESLTLTEKFAATPVQVFNAWIDAKMLKRWFAPGDLHVADAKADVRPGGRYRIVMQAANGDQHIVGGEYREIVAGKRLAFSWQWEGGQDVTLVELDFKAAGTGTEMILVHTQFKSSEDRDRHNHGWAGCIAKLRDCL